MISKGFEEVFTKQLIDLSNLNFDKERLILERLNRDETLIAVGVNCLSDELSNHILLSRESCNLILSLLELIKNNMQLIEIEEISSTITNILKGKIKDTSSQSQINNKNDYKLINFSSRENLVIRQIANELSNEEISKKIGLNKRTIESIRSRIIKKLGVSNSIGIAKYALKSGLIT